MSTHQQVEVSYPGCDTKCKIDREIAPLILKIWELGISTRNSCQEGRPGMVWIQFCTSIDLERFIAALNLCCDGTKELRWWLEECLYKNRWVFRIVFDNYTALCGEDENAPAVFVVSASLYFPKEDYNTILEILNVVAEMKGRKFPDMSLSLISHQNDK